VFSLSFSRRLQKPSAPATFYFLPPPRASPLPNKPEGEADSAKFMNEWFNGLIKLGARTLFKSWVLVSMTGNILGT